jgi:hypothetical protein
VVIPRVFLGSVSDYWVPFLLEDKQVLDGHSQFFRGDIMDLNVAHLLLIALDLILALHQH